MTSEKPGPATLPAEVGRIGPDGFTLHIDDVSIFVRFDDFPWFRNAPAKEIRAVSRPSPEHLWWESLDIDLTLDSLRHPERYPLVARA